MGFMFQTNYAGDITFDDKLYIGGSYNVGSNTV